MVQGTQAFQLVSLRQWRVLVQDGFDLDRTLDLASTLEGGNDLRVNGDTKSSSNSGQMRSVLTIAFQFAYEVHTRETCAAMARQYVRTVVASVQRVAMALAPSRGAAAPPRQLPSNPDALSLVRHVLSSYRYHHIRTHHNTPFPRPEPSTL